MPRKRRNEEEEQHDGTPAHIRWSESGKSSNYRRRGLYFDLRNRDVLGRPFADGVFHVAAIHVYSPSTECTPLTTDDCHESQ